MRVGPYLSRVGACVGACWSLTQPRWECVGACGSLTQPCWCVWVPNSAVLVCVVPSLAALGVCWCVLVPNSAVLVRVLVRVGP